MYLSVCCNRAPPSGELAATKGSRLRGFCFYTFFSTYWRVPMPIFSACSSVAFHSILGLESLKLSWWQFQPGFARFWPSWLFGQRLCIQAGVRAGLIQRHRVKGRKDADIRQDGSIVLAVAVAVGADVLHQRNMEAGTACAYGSRVLGHFAVQHLIGAVALGIDSVKVAGTDAAAAALALGLINDGLVVCIIGDGIGAALLGAAVAAAAQALLHLRVSGGVLYHLARAGAAAHADVLESTAETGGFVALEMGQADKDICVHDGAADLCRLAVFAVRHRHLCFIGAAQAVRMMT